MKTSLEPTGYHDVRMLKNTGIEGYDESPGCIRGGSNGGYQAVHLAAKLGARSIVLVGYDFTPDGAMDHWFGLHGVGDGRPMDKKSNVQNWLRMFRDLTDELGRRGVKVENATIKSSIDWLPNISLDAKWAN
ncbi:hypothetical protein NKJ09_22840 [Mesorhizobium sp. M0189]|uniref:hypothetical protein n=1 Tax=Mesorhizobium sp. M0189 TaxID=2956909 RepID=UPI00333AF244